MKLSSPKIKNVYIFSQKSFSYISKNGTFLKKLLVLGRNFQARKIKKKQL